MNSDEDKPDTGLDLLYPSTLKGEHKKMQVNAKRGWGVKRGDEEKR